MKKFFKTYNPVLLSLLLSIALSATIAWATWSLLTLVLIGSPNVGKPDAPDIAGQARGRKEPAGDLPGLQFFITLFFILTQLPEPISSLAVFVVFNFLVLLSIGVGIVCFSVVFPVLLDLYLTRKEREERKDKH